MDLTWPFSKRAIHVIAMKNNEVMTRIGFSIRIGYYTIGNNLKILSLSSIEQSFTGFIQASVFCPLKIWLKEYAWIREIRSGLEWLLKKCLLSSIKFQFHFKPKNLNLKFFNCNLFFGS